MSERPTTRALGDTLTPSLFSTVPHPTAEQREVWQSRWNPIIDMHFPDDEAKGYPATNQLWHLGDLAVSTVDAPALEVSRAATQVRRDQIDAWFLVCPRRGVYRHAAAGRACTAGPGVPVLYSMGEAFDSRRSEGTWMTLVFSRDFTHEINAALEAARNRPLNTPMGRLLGDFILALEQRLPDLSTADLPGIATLTRQMVAACVAPSGDRLAEAAPALDETRRERIRLAIRRHMSSASLTPEKLCRLVGMSRSNLYRLFEAEGGVARYITAQRMRAAQAALSDSANQQPIRIVAESVGFVDAASFSRSFRREFGCTPRELRQQALLGRAAGGVSPGRPGAETDLPTLLRRL